MGRLIVILFAALFGMPALASDTAVNLQLVKSIPGNFSGFYTDNLQSIYLVSAATNQIKKLRSNGDSVGVFNNILRYGKISSLDVTNPLKVLVWYKDVSTIVILDRFLAPRATVDLRRLGITQVKAIAQSYDSNIWLYDEGDGKIKKIDENNNVLLESPDLRLVFDEALSPVTIIDNNGQLYLYDARLGWLIFDYYTAFVKRVDFANWQDVSVADNILSGRDSSHFFSASQKDISFHVLPVNLPLAGAVKTAWQGRMLYLLNKDGLQVYGLLQ